MRYQRNLYIAEKYILWATILSLIVGCGLMGLYLHSQGRPQKFLVRSRRIILPNLVALQQLERIDIAVMKNFRPVGARSLRVVVGLTPTNLSIRLTCYYAKFGGFAAMPSIAESLTENFFPLGTTSKGVGGVKFNHF